MALPTKPGTRYRVYMTPRTGQMTYGSEIEVTDKINISGINTIKRGIDSQDYSVGVYFYSDLELIGNNDDGYYTEGDQRSIFTYLRDKTKVRVVFENTAGDTVVYNGLVNEEGTREDALNDTIIFKVLSRDSVIRNTQISSGLITNGVFCKNAMFSILNIPEITAVLGIDINNINPTVNFVIDLGAAFDSKPTQDMLNLLLLASNSAMTIGSSGNVIIQSRDANKTTPILKIYGPFDIQRRQNIINAQNYNNGLHRMFTSVEVIDGNSISHFKDNTPLAEIYGYRQTSVTLPFITTPDTAILIAEGLLAEFSAPKPEIEVEVPTSVAHTVNLQDRVSVDWPLRITPYKNHLMPVIGVAKIGMDTLPLPNVHGSVFIPSAMEFKIIEIDEDPGTFTSTLKLRQSGKSLSDGWFSDPNNAIIGYAVIGITKIDGQGNFDDQWNPSILGAARLGSTALQ